MSEVFNRDDRITLIESKKQLPANISGQRRAMEKEKVDRIYSRLEKAILEENCTYEEARAAIDKLKEIYFNRKAGNLMKDVSIQKIASTLI